MIILKDGVCGPVKLYNVVIFTALITLNVKSGCRIKYFNKYSKKLMAFLSQNMFLSLDKLRRCKVLCVVGLAASVVHWGVIAGLVKGLSVFRTIVTTAGSWVK